MRQPIRRLRIYWKRLLHKQLSSHDIACGVSLGIFVSVVSPIGMHILLAVPLAFMLRVNKIAAVLGTLFSNPLTIGPIYWGALKMGLPLFNMNISEMRADFVADMLASTGLRDFWENLLDYGQDLFLPMLAG